MSHIFLIGFMGAGKSTVGRMVAERLGRPFIDLDVEVTSAAGRSIPEIFDTEGEQGFRDRETAALAATEDAPSSVIACGGGIVLTDGNRRALKDRGIVVYLEVEAGEALARIGDTTGRPLLESGDAAHMASTLLAAREALYRTVADATVDTTGLSQAAVAEAVLGQLAELSGQESAS